MKNNDNPFDVLTHLTLGSTQLVNAVGVTSRQLRYWETQGYISALPKMVSNARQYSIGTALKVMAIKQSLNQGQKLSTAVENAQSVITQSNYLGRMISETYLGLQEESDHIALNFGPLEDAPNQQVTGILTDDKAVFKITKRGH